MYDVTIQVTVKEYKIHDLQDTTKVTNAIVLLYM
jgi:hypothetical protein